MENQKWSFFAQFMSWLFIAIGIFLGIYACFVHADTREIHGGTWDNGNYIDRDFWALSPERSDIITALYGNVTEPSIYTKTWDQERLATCTTEWTMDVEYLSSLPTWSLHDYTIYVIDAWEYEATSTIDMGECTSIISSWTVVIHAREMGELPIINIWKSNTIMQNIVIASSEGNGIVISWSVNTTINAIEVLGNTANGKWYGIYMSETAFTNILHTKTHDNTVGIWGTHNSFSTISSLTTYNNQYGILLSLDHSTIESVDSYHNSDDGISLFDTTASAVANLHTYDNGVNNIYIEWSNENTFSDFITERSIDGIHLYNSSNNTLTNITWNTNQNWLYIENSLENTLHNITVNSNTGYWIFFSDVHYTTLNWIIASWNRQYGTYLQSSTHNTFSNSFFSQNNSWGSLLSQANNNTIINTRISTNTGAGIYIMWWYGNTISWCLLSWNTSGWIFLNAAYLTTIYNTNESSYLGFSEYALMARWWTGNNFSLFSWNNPIVIEIYSWINGSNPTQPIVFGFDTYTKNNSIIIWKSAPLLTLTGSISVGWLVDIDADILSIQNTTGNQVMFSWVTSLTVAWTTWDWKLYPPTIITTGSKICIPGKTWTTNIAKVLTTIDIVSGSTYLTMSWGSATIDTYLLSWSSGQYLKILTSIDWTNWTTNLLNTGCTLDQDLVCHFMTTGTIKLFAFWIPTNYSFTWITQSGTVIISGWMYATGVQISFTGDNISGATINNAPYSSSALITWDWIKTFVLTDIWGNTTGITFVIDTIAPLLTVNTPASWLLLTTWSMMWFSREWIETNLSWGYTLIISWATRNVHTIYGTSYILSLSSISNGAYTWRLIATDRAGNTSMTTPASFTITTPLLPTTRLLTGNLYYTTARYTKEYVSLYVWTNKLATYSFTGDFSSSPLTWAGLNGDMTWTLYLSGPDGLKNISLQLTDWTTTTGNIFTVYLDTTAPTLPNLLSPISGNTATGAFSLSWAPSTDTWVWLSGYQYFISTTGTFAHTIKSWFTTSNSVALANQELGTTGAFYRQIKAIDRLGNVWTSAIQSFIYSGISDIVPDIFSFNRISSAKLNKVYWSNTITITWLSANTPVLATINRWVLYISGNMVGTSGYVQNWWTVKIELISRDAYEEDITSTLDINGVSAIFRISTETEEEANSTTAHYSIISSNLSSTEKLQIIAIFEALQEVYAGIKESEFFDSLTTMLSSKIDDLGTSTTDKNKRESLQYLYDLIDQYRSDEVDNNDISDTSRINNGIYTAPNGKKYPITYNSTKKQFTSSSFLTPKYFPTLDVLKYTIDIANPAWSKYSAAKTIKARRGKLVLDGTWQTSPYTAPNHKVFYFFKTIEGKYSSYTFTVEKYFDSLEEVKEYIYNNNR